MLTITLQLPATASHFTFRNIPTCVGKTLKPTVFESVFQKHPHLRGENWRVLPQDRTSWRNIPTCVGKTTPSPTAPKSFTETSPPAWGKPMLCIEASVVCWKHPHLRGENGARVSMRKPRPETSPPAWGKRRDMGQSFFTSGNIPTCVGKTPRRSRHAPLLEKHPHLRGENQSIRARCRGCRETSPPAWGKLP